MFDPQYEKSAYFETLMEIDTQQTHLLQRKAELLENELAKTNLQLGISKYNNTLQNKSKKLKIISNALPFRNTSKKHVLFLSSVILLALSVNPVDGYFFVFDDTSSNDSSMKSKFVIENLRGDTIDTMKSWKLLPDESLNVNLINGDVLTVEQYDAVLKAITSMDSVELDDYLLNRGAQGSESTYYLGWAGAMTAAKSTETIYAIPADYHIFQSSNGEGHIVIDFSNLIDMDGFSGYTRSVIEDDEILKSYITIYDIESLEASELATILRHEFGHALGLGHSTDPEDLMAPAILTDFPYISECIVDAMVVLYDGHESGMAVCKK